jgi:hypothetical protein
MLKSLITCALAIGVAGLPVLGSEARAQSAGGNACVSGSARAPEAAIQDFVSSPEALLARHPEGGRALTLEVRSILTSDVTAAEAMASLAKSASPSQKASLGAGSSQAVQACVRNRPDLAVKLQAVMGQVADGQFMAAFLSAAGGVDSASISAGGGVGGATGGDGNNAGNSGSSGGNRTVADSSEGGTTATPSTSASLAGGSIASDALSVSPTR